MIRLRHFILPILLATVAAPAVGIAGSPFDRPFARLVSFGDSLSDSGSFFALVGLNSTPPYSPIPDAPYAIGANHFTNGPTWVEQLARMIDVTPSAGPAYRSGHAFSNFAIGGARARPVGLMPNLSAQVATYVASSSRSPIEDDLVVMWIGANDVRDALQTLLVTQDQAAAVAILGAALTATQDNLLALHAAGAQRFLIVNVPNFAVTPVIRSLGPQAMGAASGMSAAYNRSLTGLLDGLEQLWGQRILRLDAATLLGSVYQQPAAFGLTDSLTPCLRFGTLDHAVCTFPQEHLFWDGLHPTSAAHGILADAARGVIVAALPAVTAE